jgi:CubicO group peptidase (beta-lactamase class C family)
MLRYARWQIAERDDAVRLSHWPVWGDTLAWSASRRGYAVGYNWQMLRSSDGVRRIFQDGNVPGYSALSVVFPELGLGIVVLSNELDRSTQRAISRSPIRSRSPSIRGRGRDRSQGANEASGAPARPIQGLLAEQPTRS